MIRSRSRFWIPPAQFVASGGGVQLVPIQVGTRATENSSLTVSASLSTPPTVGNWIVAVLTKGSGYSGQTPTGWTATDNASPANPSGGIRAFAVGQANAVGVFAWEVVTTTGGTYTATFTLEPGSLAPNQGATLIEVPPLDGSNLVDLLVELDNDASYATNFNVTTSATDAAYEFVVAVTAPRSDGSFNGSPSPSVPPTNYTTIFNVTTGDGAGYAAYRATTATGAQSIDFSGVPADGNPSMVVVSFRGA